MSIHLPAILGFTRGTRVLTHPHIIILMYDPNTAAASPGYALAIRMTAPGAGASRLLKEVLRSPFFLCLLSGDVIISI